MNSTTTNSIKHLKLSVKILTNETVIVFFTSILQIKYSEEKQINALVSLRQMYVWQQESTPID